MHEGALLPRREEYEQGESGHQLCSGEYQADILQYQLAKVTKEGVKISDSKSAETYWGFAEGLRGYGSQTQ